MEELEVGECEAKPPTLKRPNPGEGMVITFTFVLV